MLKTLDYTIRIGSTPNFIYIFAWFPRGLEPLQQSSRCRIYQVVDIFETLCYYIM